MFRTRGVSWKLSPRKPSHNQWREIYLGVALTTMATLLLELSLTRIFSVVFYYHFAFLAISIALFGLGLGGVFSYFVAGWKADLFTRLGALSAVNSLLVILALALILAQGNQPTSWDLAVIYFVTALPFVVSGAIVSLVIGETIDRVNRVYFFDLLGAAAGCFLLLALHRCGHHVRRCRRHLAQPGGKRPRARRERGPGPGAHGLSGVQPEAPRPRHSPRQRTDHRQRNLSPVEQLLARRPDAPG
jgi:hypothetical protein